MWEVFIKSLYHHKPVSHTYDLLVIQRSKRKWSIHRFFSYEHLHLLWIFRFAMFNLQMISGKSMVSGSIVINFPYKQINLQINFPYKHLHLHTDRWHQGTLRGPSSWGWSPQQHHPETPRIRPRGLAVHLERSLCHGTQRLLGGIPTHPIFFVTKDDYFQYIRKNMSQTTNQKFFFK